MKTASRRVVGNTLASTGPGSPGSTRRGRGRGGGGGGGGGMRRGWNMTVLMGSATLAALYGRFLLLGEAGHQQPQPQEPQPQEPQQQYQQQQYQQHGAAEAAPAAWAGSDFSCFDPALPNITIFATGGTIAGSASSGRDMTGYEIGSLGVEALVRAVPEACQVGNIRAVEVANMGSHNMRSDILVGLAAAVQGEVDSPLTQGAVVTHGTDTLEETAFFLDLTVSTDKPVVAVGAMRPATAVSADGPMNLLTAVSLAASESGRGRGVMVAMNDRIGAARFATKANANRVDAFRAPEQGYLGVFENTRPVFFYPPARPLGHRHFDLGRQRDQHQHQHQHQHQLQQQLQHHRGAPPPRRLPRVDILYGHQELEPGLFRSAVDLGARGVVLAGVGAGWWPTEARLEVEAEAAARGVAVMTSSRSQSGFVDDSSGGIGCGFLDPQRCRVQLQLCLEAGLSMDEIRRVFQFTG